MAVFYSAAISLQSRKHSYGGVVGVSTFPLAPGLGNV
jgi:hypothetical protein